MTPKKIHGNIFLGVNAKKEAKTAHSPVLRALEQGREVWGSIPQLVMGKNLGQVSHPTVLLATQQ
jgi:hypothetical protein